MKQYTIQASINELEKKVAAGGGGGGASSAADVSYVNTASGLAAENVQAAIDEVVGDISEVVEDIDLKSEITTTERLIGKYLGEDLYENVLTFTQETTLTADTWSKTEFDSTGVKGFIDARLIAEPGCIIASASIVDAKIALNSPRNVQVSPGTVTWYLLIRYTKVTAQNNRRKK